MTRPMPIDCLANSILYLSSLLADQPRSIDRYIDYFGGVTRRVGGGSPSAVRLAS